MLAQDYQLSTGLSAETSGGLLLALPSDKAAHVTRLCAMLAFFGAATVCLQVCGLQELAVKVEAYISDLQMYH
eukprot:4117699-Amphidinium_carterae.1